MLTNRLGGKTYNLGGIYVKVMGKKQKLAASILGVLLCTGMARAEVMEESYTLDPIVVTAQRQETRDVNTPAATKVLTAEELKDSGAKTVFDAISFTTGVTNFSYGPGGLDYGAMDSRVNIRGLERGALILVNGAPINLNGKNSISGIMLENVEKVEMIKGAASALYGAEALGGVVNIITKTPEKEGGTVLAGLGNLGYKKYGVSYTADKITLTVGKEFWGAQDQTSPIRYDYGGSKGFDYYNNRDKGDSFGLAINAKLNDRLTFNYMRSAIHSRYGQIVVPGSVTNPAKDPLKESKLYHYYDVKNNASLVYDYNDTKVVVFLNNRNLFGETGDLKSFSYKANNSNYFAKKIGVDVQHKWEMNNGKSSFIGGVLVSRDTYKGTGKTTSSLRAGRNTFAVYGSYSYDFTPSFTNIFGARFSHIEDPVKNQDVFMPQWQMLYKVREDASFYTNVGRAFTMPNLSDSFTYVNGQYASVSGKNLKPEDGWNYEIGYKRITDKAALKIALYHMRFKNFFDWAPNPEDGGRKTLRVNAGKFKNTGIEVDYTRAIGQGVRASIGMAVSNPEKQDVKTKKWVQAYPKLQFNAGISYKKDRWDTSLSLNWLTKRLMNRDGTINPDLINLNAHVGYTISASQSIHLNLNNILDRDNVITNGDWEYWDRPFNVSLSYEYTF